MSETAQGLIGLVMIVKDEAHGIARTIESLRGEIDRWTILDTGSTDGTPGVVRDLLQSVPGELHEEPFVDFSTSRNRALDLHGDATTYTLMPDSDDYLAGPVGDLRTFCQTRVGATGVDDEAYLIAIRRGTLSYSLPLLLRATARWRYRGRVHEYASRDGAPPATVQVPDVELRQDVVAQSAEASRVRWARDLTLLQADLAADPRNERAAFYLAQTLECLGRHEEALAAYERRIELGGWADETFEAALRRAGVLAALDRPWPEVLEAYLAACTRDPRRAEPLYRIASHYYEHQKHPLSYLYASLAADLPRPPTSMFVDADVYDWRAADTASISAYYLAQSTGSASMREIGRRLAERAVRARPLDARLRHNLSFYARPARELFPGFTTRRLALSTEAPWSPMNPSVHFDGERWRCLVRTVNYRLGDGIYYGPGGDEIRTRNFLLELTSELETARAVEMIDRDPTPRSDFPVHGFEDCRLFTVGDRLLATCTVCDFTPGGAREIALLSIDPADYSIRRAVPLRGPWSDRHQKNWMPLADRGSLRLIYATLPEIVLSVPTIESGGDVTIDMCGVSSLDSGTLRGGSQGVRTPAGWLFVVHAVEASGDARTYLHRFVAMSPELRVTAMSDPFCFNHHGIEFCAGLALDGQRLVASFGVEDREAWLGIFRLDEVLGRLRRDFVIW